LEGWDRLGGVGQHPDGQLRRKGQPTYRIFGLIYLREESPHSFETAAGDIFYGTSWHFVLQTSPARCHHSTVESGETSSRNDLGTATIKKKSPPSPLSHCSSRGPATESTLVVKSYLKRMVWSVSVWNFHAFIVSIQWKAIVQQS